MLLHLKVRNFAIIDEAEVTLAPGFTVITGETGAGKSILIDALVLALGGRASFDVVRNGAQAAEIEALFDISSQLLVRARLEQRELLGDDPDVLLIRRVIGPKGKAKVLINGYLATVATLSEIVRGLADISGQHEQLSLLSVDNHIDILDAYGELDGLKSAYREAYDRLQALRRERQQLRASAEQNLQRADFLRFQLDEIERVAPQPGEDEALELERRRLAHAEKLQQGAVLAEALLYGEDGSAFDKLGKAAAELEALCRIDDELFATAQTLESARRELQEAARELQRYASRIEVDPERLAWVEDRLSALARLCKKHGCTVGELVAKKEELARELDNLEHSDARLAELDRQAALCERELLRLGGQLSEARRGAAARLSEAILREVAEMELADAAFVTDVRERQGGAEAASPSGLDEVEFLWSANRGEPPKPLAKIASGGELSRLMLAVKTVLASRDLVSLYVFDEVDTGLGGRAADAIGRKIQRVARGHQALAITHLAAIAARADHHLLVVKEVHEARTVSRVKHVDGAERARELARMIDGGKANKAALDAAKQMLQRAARQG